MSMQKQIRQLCEFALNLYKEIAGVLGLLYAEKDGVADDVQALIEQRNTARKNKDWAMADKIRDELKARGITIKDTPNGTVIV